MMIEFAHAASPHWSLTGPCFKARYPTGPAVLDQRAGKDFPPTVPITFCQSVPIVKQFCRIGLILSNTSWTPNND
ncbi:MAG: hypothetical protein ACP5XB_20535 [Isosphaeraceae bacterium]